jgi:type I restriction enzyme, S subunit
MKPGYKQTEVGVIPEDWEVVRLGGCLSGFPSYGINAPATAFDMSLPAYIRITDITDDGRFSYRDRKSVNHPNAFFYELQDGDLVFARTGASTGKSYLYKPQDGKLVYAGFLIRITPSKSKLLPQYVAQFAQSSSYWQWVDANSMRSGQPGINGRQYADMPIPLPPPPEQTAIAEALGDVDEWIAALEKLIEKKRMVKQGAMQELLTGKRRLPGFSGEWEEKRLGDECDIVTKGTTPTSIGCDFSVHGINFFKIESLTAEGRILPELLAKIDSETHSILRRSQLQNRDILFSIAGALGRTAIVYESLLPANTNQALSIIRLKKDSALAHAFLLKYLAGPAIQGFIASISVQAAQANLSLEDIRNLLIPVPPLPEQTAIAAVLSDMDEELGLLEAKLAKARLVKRGMMQALLTGRVRLKVEV